MNIPASQLALALQPGATMRVPNSQFLLNPIKVGQLPIPSGRILAGDLGMVFAGSTSFVRRVAPGLYDVLATLAVPQTSPDSADEENSHRVAFFSLLFGSQPVAKFELALMDRKSPERSAISLDTAITGFADADAADGLFVDDGPAELIERTDAEFNRRPDTNQLAAIYSLETPPVTIAACKSGWGDGCYFAYWGLAADGTPAQLIIDFKLDSDDDD